MTTIASVIVGLVLAAGATVGVVVSQNSTPSHNPAGITQRVPYGK
jgi:hypothetical protein